MWQYYCELMEKWLPIRDADTLQDATNWAVWHHANSGTVRIREVKVVPVGEPIEVNTDWS